ncbi:uncharacterized protein Trissin [Ochlerotatus camptorhynchus]|uniref:uncharacterized protein Trissin n=1 Tax=Ochlerotatus camptorhynchus TaxID=644619 RepID=UPI0031E18305
MKIKVKMVNRSAACVSIILMYCVLWVACSFPVALSCDSCGRECASACGTRHFRTCCFNYLRKRSSTPPLTPPPPIANIRGGLNLEQWLSKSRLEDEHLTSNHQHRPPAIDLEGLFGANRNALENEIDYELKDGGTSSSHEAGSSKRNSIVASHTSSHVGRYRHHRLEDDRDSEQQRAASDESDPGRLQLLYEN